MAKQGTTTFRWWGSLTLRIFFLGVFSAGLFLQGLVHMEPSSAVPTQCPTLSGSIPRQLSPAPTPGVDWTDCDLIGADLRGADLVGAQLGGADLTRADLTGAVLIRAYLQGVDFTVIEPWGLHGVNLTGANLSGANLSGAWLIEGVVAPNVNLTGANLVGAVLKGNWSHANLRGVNLRQADLGLANLTGVDLTDADLTGAELTASDLTDAWVACDSGGTIGTDIVVLGDPPLSPDLPSGWLLSDGTLEAPIVSCPIKPPFAFCPSVDSDGEVNPAPRPAVDWFGCDLSGADLTRADLSGADLSGADLSSAMLQGANLTGTDLVSSDLTDADLSAANLTDSYLMLARLPGATLGQANLASADFTTAILTGVELRGANLTETDFTGADLSGSNLSAIFRTAGANFSRTKLIGTDLSDHAQLSGVAFAGADLSGSNLSGAMLQNSDLSQVNVSRANLSHASLIGATMTAASLTDADFSAANLDFTDLDQAQVACDSGGRLGTSVAGTPRNLPTGWSLISGELMVQVRACAEIGVTAKADLCPNEFMSGEITPSLEPDADWSGCDLTGARLDGLQLEGANLTRTTWGFQYVNGVNLRNARLGGAKFLGPVNFTDALIDGADLSGADLSGAYVSGAYVSGKYVTHDAPNAILGCEITGTPSALPRGWALSRQGCLMAQVSAPGDIARVCSSADAQIGMSRVRGAIYIAAAQETSCESARQKVVAVVQDGYVSRKEYATLGDLKIDFRISSAQSRLAFEALGKNPQPRKGVHQ